VTSLVEALRERVLPVVLTAAGVTLIAAGLLSYTGAAQANPLQSADPTIVTAEPGQSFPLPTLPPLTSAPPASAAPSDRVATRIVIEALGIDLPVIRPRGTSTTYPQCNVALYIQELYQPGSGKATYIYAHARDGMFGPIYERATLNRHGGPQSMIGMGVEVYTSDDQLYLYEVSEVRLDQRNLNDATNATTEELWLQTSEGPKGTIGKTQLLALPVAVVGANHKAAHPVPHPVTCG
jgi:sortase family protein